MTLAHYLRKSLVIGGKVRRHFIGRYLVGRAEWKESVIEGWIAVSVEVRGGFV